MLSSTSSVVGVASVAALETKACVNETKGADGRADADATMANRTRRETLILIGSKPVAMRQKNERPRNTSALLQ